MFGWCSSTDACSTSHHQARDGHCCPIQAHEEDLQHRTQTETIYRGTHPNRMLENPFLEGKQRERVRGGWTPPVLKPPRNTATSVGRRAPSRAIAPPANNTTCLKNTRG